MLQLAKYSALSRVGRFAAQGGNRWIGLLACLCLGLLCACSSNPPQPRNASDAVLFGPATMRLHPIFTSVKNWSGGPAPDGIEALLELQDQFGDPTKASGTVIFALYQFKKFDPQRKGALLVEWVGDLTTLQAQRDRWNRTSRTYGFQLACGGLTLDQNYLLTAEFQLTSGGRLFNQLVIQQQITPNKFNIPDFGLPPTAPSSTTQPTTGEFTPTTNATAPPLMPDNSGVTPPGLRVPAP
jgi:hypothetical protein